MHIASVELEAIEVPYSWKLSEVFYALVCYLSLIFKHSDTKWDKKKQYNVNHILGEGVHMLRPHLNPLLR